jgi:hypothetical protein
MNKEELKEFVSKNIDNFAIQLKRHHNQLYNEIDGLYNFSRFAEKLYVYINGEQSIGHCKVCNEKTQFDGYWKGYPRTYCSCKCRSKEKSDKANEVRKCVICDGEFRIYKKREKTTCSNECLLKLNASKEVNEKRQVSLKDTMIKKYGVSHPSKLPDFKIKVKSTKLKRYGNENYVNTEKNKKTRLIKYGNENYVNTEKNKKTCIMKYGVDNFSKTEKFKEIHFNKTISKFTTIEPLFDVNSYCGIDKHYDFQCKVCKTTFKSYIDNGHIPLCRVCHPIDRELEQKNILSYISSLIPNIPIISSDRSVIHPQELDIYIPSKNIAIEYNGIFWHSENGGGKNKDYHITKTNKCKEKNIRLIHIFENEWLYKQDIVKRRLSHILHNENTSKIYARDCEIKEIDIKTKNEFLEKYHLQGKDNGIIKLGAYHNDELVSVMTFGKLRTILGNKKTEEDCKDYEMYRFCVGYKNVVGVAGKLFSSFVKKYEPSSVVSYADKRYSDINNCYLNFIGFRSLKDTSPGYWYFKLNNTTNIYHRYNFRKSILHKKLQSFNPSLTEWENMQLNGYDRIWDCGHYKYVWENTNKNFKYSVK